MRSIGALRVVMNVETLDDSKDYQDQYDSVPGFAVHQQFHFLRALQIRLSGVLEQSMLCILR